MKTVSNRISEAELPDIMSPRDVARFLGVHQQAGYELVHQKGFPVVRIGKKYLVRKEALFRWLEAQEQKD